MVEQSYGSWDEADPQYNAGYTQGGEGGDGVFYDPKTGNYYGIIRSRLKTGSSGVFGSKGSKYGSVQKDVYILGEDQLDDFRAFYKTYDGGKIKGSNSYGKASAQFTRLAYAERKDGKIVRQRSPMSAMMSDSEQEPYDMDAFGGELGVAGEKPKRRNGLDPAGAPDQEYEDAWLDMFEGQSASYRGETTAGDRGRARKTELQKRDYARKRYADSMYSIGF